MTACLYSTGFVNVNMSFFGGNHALPVLQECIYDGRIGLCSAGHKMHISFVLQIAGVENQFYSLCSVIVKSISNSLFHVGQCKLLNYLVSCPGHIVIVKVNHLQ